MFFATDSWQLYPSTLALYFLFGSFERSLSNLSHLDNSTIVLFLPFFFQDFDRTEFSPRFFHFSFVFCFSFPTLENCLFAFMFIFRALALYDCSFVWWKKVIKTKQKKDKNNTHDVDNTNFSRCFDGIHVKLWLCFLSLPLRGRMKKKKER